MPLSYVSWMSHAKRAQCLSLRTFPTTSRLNSIYVNNLHLLLSLKSEKSGWWSIVVILLQSLSPATPLERVKRFAADSAAKLQDSAHKVQKEMTKQMKKRKWSSWWWLPVLVLLAAIFLGGVSMGRNSAWHKQMSRQM